MNRGSGRAVVNRDDVLGGVVWVWVWVCGCVGAGVGVWVWVWVYIYIYIYIYIYTYIPPFSPGLLKNPPPPLLKLF